jgi:Putative peptidoglycan binding domain
MEFAMHTLRQGSHDPAVIFLQRLLNQYLFQVPGADVLNEDGSFGRRTAEALRLFQTNYHGPQGALEPDGIAGPRTWRALGLSSEVTWPVPVVGQIATMSCWVVSAGLATGRMSSDLPETAQFNPDSGGLPTNAANLDAYARDNGMRRLQTVPTDIATLMPHIRRGPAIIVGDWSTGGRHVVVVSGVFWASDPGSMIQVNDPLPYGRGSRVITDYPVMNLSDGLFEPIAVIVQ